MARSQKYPPYSWDLTKERQFTRRPGQPARERLAVIDHDRRVVRISSICRSAAVLEHVVTAAVRRLVQDRLPYVRATVLRLSDPFNVGDPLPPGKVRMCGHLVTPQAWPWEAVTAADA